MFNIGLGELLFIAILVLVVVGPERLPKVMREFGRIVREIRLIVNEMTSQFADELQPFQELQQPLEELRQLADDINPVKQVTKISLDLDAKATGKQAARPPRVSAAGDNTSASANIVMPPKKVKPTAAFQARSSAPAANPVKIIAQAKKRAPNTESSPDRTDS